MSSTFKIHGALIAFACVAGTGCDSNEDGRAANDAASAEAAEVSQAAAKVNARVKEVRDKLAKGDNAKFACVGSLATHKALATSSDASEKKAYDELAHVCFVEQPNHEIAKIRKKIEAGEELKSTETVSLSSILKGKDFPTEGEPAKVAVEAKKLMEVEIPIYKIQQHLKTAKQEQDEGKRVSMGCIKAKQVVDKSGAALEGDPSAEPVLSAYAQTCPKS